MQQCLFDRRWDIGVDLPWWWWRSDDMLNRHRVRGLGFEGELPCKELVGDDRQAIVIASRNCFALRLFGSHVFGRSDAHPGLCKMFLVGDDTCNAEVSQHQPVITAQEHITRFNITMYDVLLV